MLLLPFSLAGLPVLLFSTGFAIACDILCAATGHLLRWAGSLRARFASGQLIELRSQALWSQPVKDPPHPQASSIAISLHNEVESELVLVLGLLLTCCEILSTCLPSLPLFFQLQKKMERNKALPSCETQFLFCKVLIYYMAP